LSGTLLTTETVVSRSVPWRLHMHGPSASVLTSGFASARDPKMRFLGTFSWDLLRPCVRCLKQGGKRGTARRLRFRGRVIGGHVSAAGCTGCARAGAVLKSPTGFWVRHGPLLTNSDGAEAAFRGPRI
jgi:hypothetical protein